MIQKFKELMTKAHKVINEQEAYKEAEKINTLRAGSSGALTSDGKALYTQCGRLAQARYLGFQSQPTEEMRSMFNGGLTLESYIEQRFRTLDLQYVKEEMVEGEIDDGVIVSGRPDFDVLIKLEDDIHEAVGIEVKSLASPFSVIKLEKNGFPFMKHLLQAATYSLLLHRNKWMVVVGWAFNVNQNGKKIESSQKWFTLHHEHPSGKFSIENEKGKTIELPFDKYDIIRYYKEMQLGIKDKKLMPRPTELELRVDTYDRCRYCPMSNACNEYDKGMIDFDQWLTRIPITKESI